MTSGSLSLELGAVNTAGAHSVQNTNAGTAKLRFLATSHGIRKRCPDCNQLACTATQHLDFPTMGEYSWVA